MSLPFVLGAGAIGYFWYQGDQAANAAPPKAAPPPTSAKSPIVQKMAVAGVSRYGTAAVAPKTLLEVAAVAKSNVAKSTFSTLRTGTTAKINASIQTAASAPTGHAVDPYTQPGGGSNWGAQTSQAAQQTLDNIEARAKSEYDKLTASAKEAGAAALNESLGTDLTGKESWEEAGKKIGAAVAAVGGAAACNAIPGVGTVAAPICGRLAAQVGAYLGDKLGGWAKDAYAQISSYAEEAWDEVEGYVSDQVEIVGDYAEDAWDSAASALGF